MKEEFKIQISTLRNSLWKLQTGIIKDILFNLLVYLDVITKGSDMKV